MIAVDAEATSPRSKGAVLEAKFTLPWQFPDVV